MDIEKYTPRWHSEVIRLAGEVFGDGYFDRPWEAATQPESVMLVSHEDDERLIGFAQGQVLPRGSLADYLDRRVPDLPPEIAEADANGALGAIQAVAVDASYRRRGVGYKLLEVLHDTLVGLGADKLITTFKRGPSASPVDPLMAKLGFEPWLRLPSYWQQRCESGEFHCIDRRDGCTCEAVFFRKAVY